MNIDTAQQIHKASIALLGDPGVKIEHDQIVNKLRKAGAKAGMNSNVVRFPEELVMECIERAPSEVILADRRNGGHTVTPGGESLVWSVPGMYILRNGQHRHFLKSDMADISRLMHCRKPAVFSECLWRMYLHWDAISSDSELWLKTLPNISGFLAFLPKERMLFVR